MIAFFFSNLFLGIRFIWIVFTYIWWIVIPIWLLYVAEETWKYYLSTKKLNGTAWMLLEIRIPREIQKSPEAMERVFAGLHGPYDPPTIFKDYFLDPKIRLWYNFEIAGEGGELRFYVYIPKSWRNLVEAQIYAQYPDVTISEALEDYTSAIPTQVPSDDFDFWGMEVQLAKEDPYPILTYKDFETLTSTEAEEEAKIDPLSAFAESLAKLRPGEHIWFQILMRPCGPPGMGPKDKWADEGKKLVDKLAGREKPPPPAWHAPITDVAGALFEEVGEHISELASPGSSSGERGLGRLGGGGKKDESKKEPSKLQHITAGEKDIISAIERKISKYGYETIIRVMYLARRDVFDMAHVGSLFGMIKQFNTQHANALRPNGGALTRKKDYLFGFFSSTAYQIRVKRGLLYSYKKRDLFWDTKLLFQGFLGTLFPIFSGKLRSKTMVLNTEELATLYHFPGLTVSGPAMPRIQAKPGEPPVNLPIG